MAIIYNLDIKPPNDYYFNVAEEALSGVSEVVLPGSALVNVFPGLRHLPKWVPGIGLQKAAVVRKLLVEMKDGTFDYARRQMVSVISLVDMRDPEFRPICSRKEITPPSLPGYWKKMMPQGDLRKTWKSSKKLQQLPMQVG